MGVRYVSPRGVGNGYSSYPFGSVTNQLRRSPLLTLEKRSPSLHIMRLVFLFVLYVRRTIAHVLDIHLLTLLL